MDSREVVNRLMKWRNTNAYPGVFKDRPASNNSKVSEYTINSGVVTPTNNISHTNLVFLTAMYEAEKNQTTTDYKGRGVDVAIGSTIKETLCEVKRVEHDSRNVIYDIAIYDEREGNITALKVDISTNKIIADSDKVSNLALMGCLWNEFYSDREFYDNWIIFTTSLDNSDVDAAWDSASILNDNIYRRILNGNVPISSFNKGVTNVSLERAIAGGLYSPTSVQMGEFEYLSETTGEVKTEKAIPHSEFVGKYQIDKDRVYTELEKEMMQNNQLEDFYIVDSDDIEICNDIVHTTNTKKPFRNFVFVGPPGSGKSQKAKAIANAIVEPQVISTCNPSMEIFDFIGQVMPPSSDSLEKEAWNLAAKLEELGGINYKNVAKVYGLPNCDDIMMAPGEVYECLTGSSKNMLGKTPSVSEVVREWTTFMADKVNDVITKLRVAMKEGAGFTFTETDFIKAIENGWLIEVQEPNVILNEGVLVGLNSLLNEGVITLQTGKMVKRHRDSVIIFTTNHNLYGLRNMNQSFLDRAAEVFYIDRPPVQVVADRIMSISGCTDRKMAMEMAKLGSVISTAMEKEGIEDGVCEMRSLINWAIKSAYMNPYDAAITTVINKTSFEPKNRARLMKKLDESYFYQFKGR